MAQAAINTKEAETVEAVAAPKPIEVDPKQVWINRADLRWKQVEVGMPEGAISDDVTNPKIWKKVQATPTKALCWKDELVIFGADMSWYALARVKAATTTEAWLKIEKSGSFCDIDQQLHFDDKFRVILVAGGYGVERKSDGVRIGSQIFNTEAQAIDHIRRQYTTRAAW